jgi:hypothetical protein
MVEETFVHHGTVPLFKIASQRLGLCGQFGREGRYLTLFHIRQERLTKGGGQVLQKFPGIHRSCRIHPCGILSLLLQTLLSQHLLLNVGRQGGQELRVHLSHHPALLSG